ncbi:hypothetical protein CBL_09746 [Carabus blaptoides fortunei]
MGQRMADLNLLCDAFTANNEKHPSQSGAQLLLPPLWLLLAPLVTAPESQTCWNGSHPNTSTSADELTAPPLHATSSPPLSTRADTRDSWCCCAAAHGRCCTLNSSGNRHLSYHRK